MDVLQLAIQMREHNIYVHLHPTEYILGGNYWIQRTCYDYRYNRESFTYLLACTPRSTFKREIDEYNGCIRIVHTDEEASIFWEVGHRRGRFVVIFLI